jgi:vancomycin resistance protein YoaR
MKPYISLFLLATLIWACLGWSQVSASPVLVKDIIKTVSTTQTHPLTLTETDFSILNTPTITNDWPVGETPLVLTPARLVRRQNNLVLSTIDPDVAYSFVKNRSLSLPTTAQEAVMVVDNDRVTDFSPGQTGLLADLRASALALINTVGQGEKTFIFKGVSIEPKTNLKQTNTLGIQDFLAGGISDFSHSSKNRLANIDAGMKQVRGALVPPGQIFSFGEKLGDVTAEKGFKPEIVIKADGLKPELGGGICQVSSTLFRAVMQSGMQITQRRNHAFSVNHYFPPGTDATIYTPVTDLKFKNDTPAYVLIWPYYLDKDHLAFDLYGTKDGRSVVVDEPVQWDRKPDGSLKASWSRHVTMNGITRDDTLKSNYLPPALFKKEEKFIIASQATTPPNSVPETENITTKPQ